MEKIFCLLLFCVLFVSETSEAAWLIYERISPSPLSRNDWFTVAQDLPMGGVGEGWHLLDSTSYATYQEAAAAADAARLSERFTNVCERTYNVYSNINTRQFSVIHAVDAASPGEGFQLFRSGLCCEDAFDLAFGPLTGAAGLSPSDCRVVRQQSISGLVVRGPKGWLSLTNTPLPKVGKKGGKVVDSPDLTSRPPGPEEITRPNDSVLQAGLKPEDEVWVNATPELRNAEALGGSETSCTVRGTGEFENQTTTINWSTPQRMLRIGDRISVSISATANKNFSVTTNAAIGLDRGATWKVDAPIQEAYAVYPNCPAGLGWPCSQSNKLSAVLQSAGNEFYIYVVCNGRGTQMVSAWKYKKMKAAEIPQDIISTLGSPDSGTTGAPETSEPAEKRPYTYILKDGNPFKSSLNPGEMAEMKIKCGQLLSEMKVYVPKKDDLSQAYYGAATKFLAFDSLGAGILVAQMTLVATAKCGAYLSVDHPMRREAGPIASGKAVTWQFSIDKGPLRISTDESNALSEIRTPVGVIQAEGPAEYTAIHDPSGNRTFVVAQRGALRLYEGRSSAMPVTLPQSEVAVIYRRGVEVVSSASTVPEDSHLQTGRIDSFKWIGKDEDKVGQWGNGRPDGTPDGHFALKLNVPEQIEISSIAVYSADNSGSPAGGQIWHSRENKYWMIGIFHQGSQLNQSHKESLGRFSGNVMFDLYCNDSGWFKDGQTFLVELEFANGAKTSKTVRLGKR